MNNINLRKYFKKKSPAGSIMLMIFGGLIVWMASGLRNGFAWEFIGFVLLILGTLKVFIRIFNQSDKKVDLLCEEIAKEYFREKEEEISIHEGKDIEKYELFEYSFENVFPFRKSIKGRDGIYRTTILSMWSIYLIDEKVFYYNKIISLIGNESLEEKRDFEIQNIQVLTIKNSKIDSCLAMTITGNERILIRTRLKEELYSLYERLQKGRNKEA